MLYIVSTPIGNLEDITFRAVRIFREADFILCEDTRVAKKLLAHYGIGTKTKSYHQHSGKIKEEWVLTHLNEGCNIALVTDAGTPGISDPGGKLAAYLLENGYTQIEVLPGPSALTAALSVCGLKADKFVFLGYFPTKKGRNTLFKEIEQEKRTVVFFESKHRVRKTLEQLKVYAGLRRVCVARELTKKFETVYRGKIEDVLENLVEKGEFVVVVEGRC